jgi:hypothetical protein
VTGCYFLLQPDRELGEEYSIHFRIQGLIIKIIERLLLRYLSEDNCQLTNVNDSFNTMHLIREPMSDECILKDTGKTLCVLPTKTIQYCQNDTFFPLLCCPMKKIELKYLTYYKQGNLELFISHGKKTLAGEFLHMVIKVDTFFFTYIL